MKKVQPMSHVRSLSLGAALLGAALAIPAAAGAAESSTTASKGKKALDPNEVVCRKQEVLGSRLKSVRVCRTRAEWADARNETRGEIERVQVQRAGAVACDPWMPQRSSTPRSASAFSTMATSSSVRRHRMLR